MDGDPAATPPRVALLFTRFPVATETFLQREVESLRAFGASPAIWSLWPSPDPLHGSLRPDHQFRPWHLISLLWWIPYWTVCAPHAMKRLARVLVEARRPNLTNFFETLLGMGYGICRAREARDQVDHLHAMWASAPATAAWVIHLLCGVKYSMAGHAYDLFEDGGDGLLEVKIPEASFIRTSTEAGRERWIRHGAKPGAVHVIRRGLVRQPDYSPKPHPQPPYHLVSVGRMVEKMGYPFLLEVLAQLQTAGVDYTATLVGDGPLRRSIEKLARRKGLIDRITFKAALPYSQVEMLLSEADLLIFAGQVARSGDRAGFPNIIGEAMAWGVPVCATPVGAVLEGIDDGRSGLIATRPAEAADRIRELMNNPEAYSDIRSAARQWVETEFDANENMRRFWKLLTTSHPQNRTADP